MAEQTPYFRVDIDVLCDEAIMDLTFDYGPLVAATWLALMALAKQQRDLGRVRTSIREVAQMIGDRPNGSFDRRVELWQGMIDRGLMALEDGDLSGGEVVVSIANWKAKQTMTAAEKQREYRQSSKNPERYQSGNNVTKSPTLKMVPVTMSAQTGIQGKNKQPALPSLTTFDQSPPPPSEPDGVGNDDTPSPSQPKIDCVATRRRVFDFWLRLFEVHDSVTWKAGSPRDKRIGWALREYGPVLVEQCLRGYRRDPWPDRRAKLANYDLTLLLRNESKVDNGVDLYRQQQGRSGSVSSVESSAAQVAADMWGEDE